MAKAKVARPRPVDMHYRAMSLLEYLVPKALMFQQSPARPPEVRAETFDNVMKVYTDLIAKLREIHG